MKHPWKEQARSHWQTYRPKMYSQLDQSGNLENSLNNATKRAEDEYVSSIQNGMNPWEAESEAKKNNLLLPAEEDMRELGADPGRLPIPRT